MMQAIITKIMSVIMSIIMSIIGLIPGLGNIFNKNIEDVKVFSTGYSGLIVSGSDTTRIIENYQQWEEFKETDMNSKLSFSYINDIGRSFFYNNNLIIVDVLVTDASYDIAVESITENGDTVNIKYYLYNKDIDAFPTSCYDTILAVTSKNISKINLEEIKNTETTVEKVKIVSSYSGLIHEHFNTNPYVFKTYNEWSYFKENDMNASFNDKIKEYDESFFENYNLVALTQVHPDSSYNIFISSIVEDRETLNIEYYNVQHGFLAYTVICFDTIFIVTSKNISNVNVIQERMEIPFIPWKYAEYDFMITDAEYNGMNENTNETTFLINTYEQWKQLEENSNWKISNYSQIPYDECFFDKNNLAVLFVKLNDTSYQARLDYIREDVENVEISYYIVKQPGVYLDVENYQVFVIPVEKNINNITTKSNEFSIPFRLDGKLINE